MYEKPRVAHFPALTSPFGAKGRPPFRRRSRQLMNLHGDFRRNQIDFAACASSDIESEFDSFATLREESG